MNRSEIYEHDPEEYIGAFEEFLQAWVSNDEETDLLSWLIASAAEADATSAETAVVRRLIVLGYIAAEWERWTDKFSEERLGLSENMRRKSARECAAQGIPEQLHELMYGTRLMRVRIADQAKAGDESIIERLAVLWERVVLANTEFESVPSEDTLNGMRALFDLGIGLNLFLRWHEDMEKRGVPEDERWDDMGLAPIYDDRLADLSFPLTLRGCTLDEADTVGYEIRSDGKLGGYHLTAFLAEGEVAKIIQFVRSGRLGTRSVAVIEPSHADVLRDLGFQEAVFPNEQRYRLSSWGGLSGIRKIKE